MNDAEIVALKKSADKIYAMGYRNGQIEMKNRVLKLVNRDWTIVGKSAVDTAMYFLKKINKARITPAEAGKQHK